MSFSDRLLASERGPGGDAEAVSDLIRRSATANAALMRGDVERYSELVPFADEFVLMSPFGGTPSRASDYTPERMEAMGRFFRNGTFEQEVVEPYASDDMVVLATIERIEVEVGGLPLQDWMLRVTLVFRRDESGWRWSIAMRTLSPGHHAGTGGRAGAGKYGFAASLSSGFARPRASVIPKSLRFPKEPPMATALSHAPGLIASRPGDPPIAASGRTLAIHEWTMPGPSYLHVHRSDDEGWHVLEGVLRFHLADRSFDARAGTTVFLPAGTVHTYSCPVPSRYLIFLTPRMDRLISRLLALTDQTQVPQVLAEYDTEIVA